MICESGLSKGQDNLLIITGIPPIRISLFKEYGIPIPSFIADLAGDEGYLSLPLHTLGAVTIATYLQTHGLEVEVRDFFTDEIDVTHARIVGISTTFMEMHHIKEIAVYVKRQNPSAIAVIGGPISWSFSPEEILKTAPDVDIIVCGEGEKSFLELVTSIRYNHPLERVKGIVFREGKKIIRTPPRDMMDLNELTPPDWRLIDLRKKMDILPVETARGCVYNCAFCSEVHYWGKPVRFRSTESVIKEIRQNVNDSGIRTFRFVDSCFTAPEERCGEICDSIFEQFIEKGLEIRWTSYARINNLTRDLLKKMRRAGCVALDIGMESGDRDILQSMKKGYSDKRILESIQTAKDMGILTHCNIVVGFPGETHETIDNTIDVLNRANPDTYDCMLLYVAPHSYIYENRESFGVKGERLKWEHQTMTSEEASRAMFSIPEKVSSSCLFPGGEYCAGMLSSLGHSTDEIRSFYRGITRGEGDKTILMKMAREVFNV